MLKWNVIIGRKCNDRRVQMLKRNVIIGFLKYAQLSTGGRFTDRRAVSSSACTSPALRRHEALLSSDSGDGGEDSHFLQDLIDISTSALTCMHVHRTDDVSRTTDLLHKSVSTPVPYSVKGDELAMRSHPPIPDGQRSGVTTMTGDVHDRAQSKH